MKIYSLMGIQVHNKIQLCYKTSEKKKECFLTDCLQQNTGDGHTLTQELLVQLLNLQSAKTSYRLCSSQGSFHNFTSTGTKTVNISLTKHSLKKKDNFVFYFVC